MNSTPKKVGYNLTRNCWTKLKWLARNKHPSLFIWSVSDENKKSFFSSVPKGFVAKSNTTYLRDNVTVKKAYLSTYIKSGIDNAYNKNSISSYVKLSEGQMSSMTAGFSVGTQAPTDTLKVFADGMNRQILTESGANIIF